MKKRMFTLLFVLCLLAIILPQVAQPVSATDAPTSGTCGDNLTWNFEPSSGTLSISGTGDMPYDYYPDDYPWSHYRSSITTLEVQYGVTSIGDYSFYNYPVLSTIILPDSITDIGDYAFCMCPELTAVNIPDSVIDIGGYAFAYCHKLSALTIPDSVTDIGFYAFCSCTELTALIIPDNVVKIGKAAFAGCEGLTTLKIGTGLTAISEYAFSDCTGLSSINIPSNVTHIESRAFSGCSGLISIDIPDSVVSVDNGCFVDCTGLTSVTLPNSVTYISPSLFSGCTKLNSVIIPNSVVRICYYAFADCVGLDSITIPNSVNSIQDRAFQNCLGLTSVIIPYNVTSIGELTFTGCTNLKEIVILNPFCEIEEDIFEASNVPIMSDCTIIYGFPSSTAEAYAQKYGYNFYSLCECTDYANGYQIAVIEPTCTENGYTHLICSKCKYTCKISPKNPINHSFTNGTCASCGAKDPDYVPPNPFTDIKNADYFYTPVLWAVKNSITLGMSATTFAPEAPCTRGQIVTFLWRACGSPEPNNTENPFTDVSSKAYYYKAVLWAVENGITTGMGNGKFSPDTTCTRAQVATFLWRSQGEPTPTNNHNPFSDVDARAYYNNPVLWAVENDITQGTGKGKFSPDDSCTRGQIVTFLYRALS